MAFKRSDTRASLDIGRAQRLLPQKERDRIVQVEFINDWLLLMTLAVDIEREIKRKQMHIASEKGEEASKTTKGVDG